MESEKVKEIKKALECCGMYKYDCEKCPYKSKGDDDDLTVNNGCGDLLLKDCTTLINELEKENETKTDTIAELLKKQEFYETEKLKQFAERLKEKLKEKVNADNVDVFVECARLSDETLKEFIKD